MMAITTRSSTSVKAADRTGLKGSIGAPRSGTGVAMLGCFLVSIPNDAAAHYSDEQQQNVGRLGDWIAAESGAICRRRLAEVCPPVGVIRCIHDARCTIIGKRSGR